MGRSTIDFPISVSGTTSFNNDTHDTGYKLGVGYRYSRHFGVELGYQDLGQQTIRITAPGSTDSGHIKVSGWSIAAVGLLPVSAQVTLLGKAGVFLSQSKVRDTWTHNGTTYVDSTSPHSTTPLLGLGVQFRLTPKWALRAEYEHFGKVKVASNASKAKADLLSVSALYHF